MNGTGLSARYLMRLTVEMHIRYCLLATSKGSGRMEPEKLKYIHGFHVLQICKKDIKPDSLVLT